MLDDVDLGDRRLTWRNLGQRCPCLDLAQRLRRYPSRRGHFHHAAVTARLAQQRAEPFSALSFPRSQRSSHHDRDTNTGIKIGHRSMR
jgi:hypothetical protein